MKKFEDFLKLIEENKKRNTQESHISFVEDNSNSIGIKYQQSYLNNTAPLKVMLYNRYEIGAIVNHTTYSPDMDISGSSRVFKINPDIDKDLLRHGLFIEDLLMIASKVSGVESIPRNRKERNNMPTVKDSATYKNVYITDDSGKYIGYITDCYGGDIFYFEMYQNPQDKQGGIHMPYKIDVLRKVYEVLNNIPKEDRDVLYETFGFAANKDSLEIVLNNWDSAVSEFKEMVDHDLSDCTE